MSTYPIFQTRRRSDILSAKKDRNNSLFVIRASQFIEFRDAIEVAKETFSQERIWQDECDYVIHKMNPLKNIATSIANSTKRYERKSSSFNHYPLLVSAHYLCSQVDLLIELIREYKEATENRSTQKSKHRLIASSLHDLTASLQDLMKELDKAM